MWRNPLRIYEPARKIPFPELRTQYIVATTFGSSRKKKRIFYMAMRIIDKFIYNPYN
jgi:hypothetical protein